MLPAYAGEFKVNNCSSPIENEHLFCPVDACRRSLSQSYLGNPNIYIFKNKYIYTIHVHYSTLAYAGQRQSDQKKDNNLVQLYNWKEQFKNDSR